MSNKCPKCGAKLSPFYLKPTCPKCQTNIMQYGFEERIENDRIKAEKEWEQFDNFLLGIKKSSIGSLVAIIRLVSFFLPIAALLIPVYKVNTSSVNLISIIKNIISDSSSVFSNTAMLLCFISFASVILLSLLCAIISLFSYTKNGFKRNVIFSALQIIVFVALSVAALINGASIHIGFILVIILQILTVFLHVLHKNSLRRTEINE
ncbi:MAG: hypothetical protein PUF01_06375 [Eubacteriales bacterium]|nr:hypothetical protein [Eubacteriales bacterium]